MLKIINQLRQLTTAHEGALLLRCCCAVVRVRGTTAQQQRRGTRCCSTILTVAWIGVREMGENNSINSINSAGARQLSGMPRLFGKQRIRTIMPGIPRAQKLTPGRPGMVSPGSTPSRGFRLRPAAIIGAYAHTGKGSPEEACRSLTALTLPHSPLGSQIFLSDCNIRAINGLNKLTCLCEWFETPPRETPYLNTTRSEHTSSRLGYRPNALVDLSGRRDRANSPGRERGRGSPGPPRRTGPDRSGRSRIDLPRNDPAAPGRDCPDRAGAEARHAAPLRTARRLVPASHLPPPDFASRGREIRPVTSRPLSPPSRRRDREAPALPFPGGGSPVRLERRGQSFPDRHRFAFAGHPVYAIGRVDRRIDGLVPGSIADHVAAEVGADHLLHQGAGRDALLGRVVFQPFDRAQRELESLRVGLFPFLWLAALLGVSLPRDSGFRRPRFRSFSQGLLSFPPRTRQRGDPPGRYRRRSVAPSIFRRSKPCDSTDGRLTGFSLASGGGGGSTGDLSGPRPTARPVPHGPGRGPCDVLRPRTGSVRGARSGRRAGSQLNPQTRKDQTSALRPPARPDRAIRRGRPDRFRPRGGTRRARPGGSTPPERPSQAL